MKRILGCAAAAFSAATRSISGSGSIAVLERRLTPVERFVDRALSMSSTSAARIGEKTAELAAEVRKTLAPFVVEGMIREVVRSGATIAWRAGG